MSEIVLSFRSPPVVEVVAGVAFDGLSAEAGALLAAFWKESLRDSFPTLQYQPPYTPSVEQFPLGGRESSFNLDVGNEFPMGRIWATGSDKQELLQLQPGWFACNWRRVKPHDEYDRWVSRREAFRRWFGALADFLASEGVGEPKITQCEVTYINHILPGSQWTNHGDYGKIFRLTLGDTESQSPEQLSAQVQYVITVEGVPKGRLYAKILPAFGRDGKTPLYVLELTARGAPLGDGLNGALPFLDLGRETINRTFLSLTTERMHDEWGLE